jgi:hypothetical protein
MKMRRFLRPALVLLPLLAAVLRAEEVTLRQSAVLKAERSVVALKAGTVVELVSREGDTLTIKYKDLTGKIPASKLDEPKAAAAKPKEDDTPANPPQTGYGKAVQKAKDNAKAHDKNVVKPTDEIMP